MTDLQTGRIERDRADDPGHAVHAPQRRSNWRNPSEQAKQITKYSSAVNSQVSKNRRVVDDTSDVMKHFSTRRVYRAVGHLNEP